MDTSMHIAVDALEPWAPVIRWTHIITISGGETTDAQIVAVDVGEAVLDNGTYALPVEIDEQTYDDAVELAGGRDRLEEFIRDQLAELASALSAKLDLRAQDPARRGEIEHHGPVTIRRSICCQAIPVTDAGEYRCSACGERALTHIQPL